jgi:hypothetical protein
MCGFIPLTIKTSGNITELTYDNGSTHAPVWVLDLGTSVKEHKRTTEMAKMKILRLV